MSVGLFKNFMIFVESLLLTVMILCCHNTDEARFWRILRLCFKNGEKDLTLFWKTAHLRNFI